MKPIDILRMRKTAAAGPMSTQWRLLFPSGTTTNNPITSAALTIAEVEMRATSGGVDQCTGGTASASSEFSGSFLASQGFDNNSGQSWATTNAGNNGSWLQYTFASAVTVNEVTILASTGSGPTSVRLQYYNGSQWVTYIESAGPLSWGSGETKTFTYSAPFVETGYDKWRLYFITGSVAAFLEIIEVEMRAVASGVDRCFGGVASAISSLDGNRQPVKAFNDDTSGFAWAPTGNGTSGWLEYDFWRKEQIAEFTIRCNGADSGPQQVRLEYYDGSTWQTAYTSASGLTWSAAQTRTFTI